MLSRSSFGGTLSEIPRGGDPDEPVLYQPTPLHADTCSMCQGKVLTLRPNDVTEQLHSAQGTSGIVLEIATLKLPETIPNSGFNPQLDGWGTVEEEIEL